MNTFWQKNIKVFERFFVLLLLTYVFLTMTLGRTFSLFHIGNLYITEVIFFLSIIIIFINIKEIGEIPRFFVVLFLIYFIFGIVCMLSGLLQGNFFVLRDVVLWGYPVLFPLIFIIFSKKHNLVKLLWIIVASNILGLLLSRFMLYRALELPTCLQFLTKFKSFNYILYYGISMAFLTSFFFFVTLRLQKFFILLLCALNLYMLFAWGVRAALPAIFFLSIFFLFRMPIKKVMKFSLYLLPLFIIVAFLSLYISDFNIVRKSVMAKLSSIKLFTSVYFEQKSVVNKASNSSDRTNTPGKKEIMDNILSSKIPQEYKEGYNNIEWRIGIWKALLGYGLESPIIGKGFGFYPILSPIPLKLGPESGIKPAHNHLITIFYKMGFFGLVLFIFLSVYTFLYGFFYLQVCKTKYIKAFLMGCLGSFIFWHSLALFFDVIDSPPTSIFLWVIMGLIFGCVQADIIENKI